MISDLNGTLGSRQFLNCAAAPVPLFLEGKLYCSIWRKILTGFSIQMESAQGLQGTVTIFFPL